VTGRGVPLGVEFGNRTRTFGTRDCDTAELPVPVLLPKYADGHECEDVVKYQSEVFLPKWHEIEKQMANWTQDNIQEFGPNLPGREVIAWFHDETIFYAHDWQKKGWYHKDAPATPYAKGEGASLMIADFVSA
jgi:hypothetical protein